MIPTKETLEKMYDELTPKNREVNMNVLRKLCEEPYGHKGGAYMVFDIPEELQDCWDDVMEDCWGGMMEDEGDVFEELWACDGDMAIWGAHGPYFFSELDDEEVYAIADRLIDRLMN